MVSQIVDPQIMFFLPKRDEFWVIFGSPLSDELSHVPRLKFLTDLGRTATNLFWNFENKNTIISNKFPLRGMYVFFLD